MISIKLQMFWRNTCEQSCGGGGDGSSSDFDGGCKNSGWVVVAMVVGCYLFPCLYAEMLFNELI